MGVIGNRRCAAAFLAPFPLGICRHRTSKLSSLAEGSGQWRTGRDAEPAAAVETWARSRETRAALAELRRRWRGLIALLDWERRPSDARRRQFGSCSRFVALGLLRRHNAASGLRSNHLRPRDDSAGLDGQPCRVSAQKATCRFCGRMLADSDGISGTLLRAVDQATATKLWSFAGVTADHSVVRPLDDRRAWSASAVTPQNEPRSHRRRLAG